MCFNIYYYVNINNSNIWLKPVDYKLLKLRYYTIYQWNWRLWQAVMMCFFCWYLNSSSSVGSIDCGWNRSCMTSMMSSIIARNLQMKIGFQLQLKSMCCNHLVRFMLFKTLRMVNRIHDTKKIGTSVPVVVIPIGEG